MKVIFNCGLLENIFLGPFLIILCKTYPRDVYIFVVILSCFADVWLVHLQFFLFVSYLDLPIVIF
jgi:hypothetical protein